MSNISIDQLSNEIMSFMQEYTDDVSEAIANKVNDVAEQVLSEVKTNHPYEDQTGGYTKGFKKTSKDDYGKTRRIIWNKKYYNLVHLLEFGHAKRGGGRVRAYPHMGPAYDKFGAKLPDDIKRIIQNGGGA